MPHAAKTPVRGVNAAAYDSEPAVSHLFAQEIVFGIQRSLMKTTQPVESSFLKQHEHARTERLYKHRSVLRQVVGKIENLVANRSLPAPDICCDAMQPSPLHQFHCPPQQCCIPQLHVGVDKKNVRRTGSSGPSVAPTGGKTARNSLDTEPARKRHGQFLCAVRRTSISQEHLRRLHQPIILPAQ